MNIFKTFLSDLILLSHGSVDVTYKRVVRVNKFSKFYQNLSKFNGFGFYRISKSAILLFTDSKYLKK
jgi:hypothetical protein